MKHKLLDAMYALVCDERFQILRVNEIDNLVGLLDQRAVNLVLIAQV